MTSPKKRASDECILYNYRRTNNNYRKNVYTYYDYWLWLFLLCWNHGPCCFGDYHCFHLRQSLTSIPCLWILLGIWLIENPSEYPAHHSRLQLTFRDWHHPETLPWPLSILLDQDTVMGSATSWVSRLWVVGIDSTPLFAHDNSNSPFFLFFKIKSLNHDSNFNSKTIEMHTVFMHPDCNK